MDEKRFCKFCGVHLFEGVKFCTNCGTIVTKLPRQPAEPNGLLSDVQSLWSRFWAKRATKQPYKIIVGAGVGMLILMFFVAGASASSTVSQDSAVQSSPLPAASAPTKAVAAPTDTPVDYSSQISATIKVPFHKTTVNGREAYVGDAVNETNKSIVTHIVIYPTKTLEDATNYAEQLVQSYKAQGYTMYKLFGDYWVAWTGKNNHVNVHLIGAMNTDWGFPATLDEGTTGS